MANIDSDLMKQALLNVVLNGGQAMADGGVLEVRLNADARMANITVRDEGEGIPDDVRPGSLTSISPPKERAAASVWP